MPKTFKFEVVTPEKVFYSDEVDMIVFNRTDGEMGVLAGHMPMVVAQAIFKTAKDNDLALEIAASGFRDMTRLAMSNTEMANDMVQMNADNIQMSLLKLYKSIGDLTNSDYLAQIEEVKSNRQSMFL